MSERTIPERPIWNSLPDAVGPEHLRQLNDAFADLIAGNRKAAELFGSSRREAMIQAVETALKFLMRFDSVQRERLQVPLSALFNDLLQLDEGHVSPALNPAKKRGRPKASAISNSIKGQSVLVVERLVLTGLPLDEAADLVARKLRSIGIMAERGHDPEVSGRTLRTWREAISADVTRQGEAARVHDWLDAMTPVPVVALLTSAEVQARREGYLTMLSDTASAALLGKTT